MRSISRFISLILLFSLSACASPAAPTPPPPPPQKVVATPTIVGAVLHNQARDAIDQSVLLPTGADPHAFQPTPQDAAKLAGAQVIFINGAGLETFLERLLQNSASQARVIDLSAGLTLLEGHEDEAAAAGPAHAPEDGDPHVWTDPNNVLTWVANAQAALVELDPANAAVYQANAAAYRQSLVELDGWISQQVAQAPPERRKLVMDHEILGYFAARYGFEQVGAVIPGFSTLAEPSAQELAALEDAIRSLGVPTLFISIDVNPVLAQRVAADTGIQLVYIYSGSLSPASGPAGTYLEFIRYNVSAIVAALK